MKIFGSILLCIFFVFSAFAKQTMVSSASEINSGFWFPGDTIVMSNGEWNKQSIKFKAVGTEDNPVVLMAETPGEVILNGYSTLAFSGEYIHVSGLYFKEGAVSGADVISFRTSSSSEAAYCRLSNTTIESYNYPDYTRDNKWVSLYGKNNRVDHCSFINKNNMGTLMVVWIKNAIPNHRIDHNYFGYRIPNLDSSGKERNGQEIIRIGDSSTSLRNARVTVENNFFEACSGEIEVISNKSCENKYINNVFYECVGMLTLRHGNRCLVQGNYFFGNNIDRTGGVRIIGEDHTVYNNYFENLRGYNWRAALCMVRGKENSALNDYAPVINANVMFNTMVNCRQAFAVNYNSSSSYKAAPTQSTVAHNHVYNTNNENTKVYISQVAIANLDVSWKNNLMNIGDYYGFEPTVEEVIEDVDPSMVSAGTAIDMLEPASGSALANYATDEFSEVTADIRGRDRGTVKVPGASQLTGNTHTEMPTRETTGADFYIATAAKKMRYATRKILNAYVFNHEIRINVAEPGVCMVNDLSGKIIHKLNVNTGVNSATAPVDGMVILSYISNKGEYASKKIFIH